MKTIAVVGLLALLAACSDYSTPPQTQTVSVAYCDPFAPLWVAFQDGDGAWTHVAPVSANGVHTYQYTFASNRGAVASVLQSAPTATSLQVLYGKPEELASASLNSPQFCGSFADKTLLGAVAGVPDVDVAIVRGGYQAEVVLYGAGSFALDHLPAGPSDILALHGTRSGPIQLDKLILRRGVDLPDSGNIPVFDFDSPEAFAPVVANVTFQGAGANEPFMLTFLRTSTLEHQFSLPFENASGAVQPYYGLPEAQLAPGDLQELRASVHGSGLNNSMSARVYFRSPVDRTVAFGPDVVAPDISIVATTPSLRLRAHFVSQDAYDGETGVSYSSDRPTNAAVLMTAAYAAITGGYDLVIPELSGVSGFDPAWAFHATTQVLWVASRIGGTLGLGVDPVPSDGATRRAGTTFDVLTP